MFRTVLFFVVLNLLAAALTGCAGEIYMAAPFLSDNNAQTAIKQEGSSFWGTNRKTINPYTFTPPGATAPLYTTMQTAQSEAARSARNDLLAAVLSVSDENVADHLASVTGTRVTVDMVAGTAALGLAGVAAVSVADTAKYLAAGAAGATGFRALFSEVVYRDALVQTLVGTIQTEREKYYETVVKPRLNEPVGSFGVGEIRRVAEEYHKRGHFYHGLTLIRQAAELANQERTQIIEGARNAEARTRVLKAQTAEAVEEAKKLEAESANADKRLENARKAKEAAELQKAAAEMNAASERTKTTDPAPKDNGAKPADQPAAGSPQPSNTTPPK